MKPMPIPDILDWLRAKLESGENFVILRDNGEERADLTLLYISMREPEPTGNTQEETER